MRISDEQPADTAEGHGYWPERDVAEHQRQWEWFRSRWNSHDEAVAGPLEVQWAQLDREPPFAVIGSEGAEGSIVVALGREDAALRFVRAEGGREVTLPSVARTLGVSPVDMDRARAAILDGLEQSERIAGRSPVERAPLDWHDLRRVDRYTDALETGYGNAWLALEHEGFNPDGIWTGTEVKPSDAALDRFAVLGRTATATATTMLAAGDKDEHVMFAARVLTGAPWDRSAQREKVEEQLDERLAGMGLHSIARQTQREFSNHRVRGISMASDQISARVAQRESVAEGEPGGPNVVQRNRERMARQVPARIRDEDPAAPVRQRSVERKPVR